MWKLGDLRLKWTWMKRLMNDWKMVYMQSTKDWHETSNRKERINSESGGQGVAKL